jgi:hypothetical protein
MWTGRRTKEVLETRPARLTIHLFQSWGVRLYCEALPGTKLHRREGHACPVAQGMSTDTDENKSSRVQYGWPTISSQRRERTLCFWFCDTSKYSDFIVDDRRKDVTIVYAGPGVPGPCAPHGGSIDARPTASSRLQVGLVFQPAAEILKFSVDN